MTVFRTAHNKSSSCVLEPLQFAQPKVWETTKHRVQAIYLWGNKSMNQCPADIQELPYVGDSVQLHKASSNIINMSFQSHVGTHKSSKILYRMNLRNINITNMYGTVCRTWFSKMAGEHHKLSLIVVKFQKVSCHPTLNVSNAGLHVPDAWSSRGPIKGIIQSGVICIHNGIAQCHKYNIQPWCLPVFMTCRERVCCRDVSYMYDWIVSWGSNQGNQGHVIKADWHRMLLERVNHEPWRVSSAYPSPVG